ncbi:MAG: fibronectin type III domain-containing protein [Acidobacteria bacterium]|nr:fibronectin type III domain-containing protein [Acidobacteriota bacterium]
MDGAHSPISADRESAVSNRMGPWMRILASPAGAWQGAVAPTPWRYHPLTLYAMGRLPKEQVPDITLFDDQTQYVSLAGQAVTGTFKTRSIYDIIGVHGERRGPVVGDELSQAVVLVSARGLATQREMDYWNYFAQRIEDPNHTGVFGENGDGSFDITTGIDLKTDVRPKNGAPIPGDHAVDLRPFGATDIYGLILDSPFPGEFKTGVETHIVGTVMDSSTTSVWFRVNFSNFTNQSASLLDVTAPVASSGRFDAALKFPSESGGVYGIVVTLVTLRPSFRSQYLTPITVTGARCATAPGAPSGLSASAGSSDILLAWQPPPLQGCALTSYVVEAGSRSGLSDFFAMSTRSTATSTSLDMSGLPAGVYFVRVRGQSVIGVGAPSNEVTVVLERCSGVSAPATPSIFTATVSGSTVTLAWAIVPAATTYVIEAGSAPGSSNLANSDLGSPSGSYVARAVGPGTYYVRLRAKSACGVSRPSNEIVVVVR